MEVECSEVGHKGITEYATAIAQAVLLITDIGMADGIMGIVTLTAASLAAIKATAVFRRI